MPDELKLCSRFWATKARTGWRSIWVGSRPKHRAGYGDWLPREGSNRVMSELLHGDVLDRVFPTGVENEKCVEVFPRFWTAQKSTLHASPGFPLASDGGES